jgi:Glycine rich protein
MPTLSEAPQGGEELEMKVRLGLVCTVVCWATFAGSAFGQTVSFFQTGGQQTFTVPAGVTSLHVAAVGGSGGAAGTGMAPGGFGGTASADLSVSAGQVLYVEVGGNGGPGSGSRAGGFNGGGGGGSGAGGGGGATDVRTLPAGDSSSLTSRLIVAGGGGGGAQAPGGANAGTPGAGPGAGGAGTGTGNGMGGDGIDNASPGSPGAFGVGGAGGPGSTGGAGGGGGIFGGGGGGAECSGSPMYCDAFSFGGNGGGGSSGFASNFSSTSGVSNTSLGTDSSGVASVTITYTGPPPAVKPKPPSAAVIGRSLSSQLVPVGKGARISAIRKHHGYTFTFTALLAGTVTISWDQIEHTRMHGHTKIKTVLIAKGSRKFSAAGKGRLTIRLTLKGRTLFKHAKRLKLTAKGTFKPSGAAGIARQRSFTLHG